MSVDRQQVTLFNEGQVLSLAGSAGCEHAADYARAAIDGYFNALLRLEGSKEAAGYAFALADRLVARVKAPTEWSPTKQAFTIEAPITPKPKRGLARLVSWRPSFYWTTFGDGFAWGFFAALALVLR
jgi:hypothetical protein